MKFTLPQVKKFCRGLLPLLLVIFCFLPGITAVQADALYPGGDGNQVLPLPDFNEVSTNIPGPESTTDTAYEIINSLITTAVDNVRGIIAALAIAFLVISGFQLVTAQGEEETINKQKKNILWALVGLALLSMSNAIAEIFEFEDQTGAFRNFFTDPSALDERIHKFDLQVQIIITFIRYIIGSIAVLYIVRSAVKMITSGYKEEVTTEEKKTIWAVLIGLLVIIVADFAVNQVLYKTRPYASSTSIWENNIKVNPEKGVNEIIGITNFIVTFTGPLALMMLIIGGILYATAGGEEERMTRAKRLIMNTLIGIVIVYAAYAIVATFISGNL